MTATTAVTTAVTILTTAATAPITGNGSNVPLDELLPVSAEGTNVDIP